jgi:hypothetical protein
MVFPLFPDPHNYYHLIFRLVIYLCLLVNHQKHYLQLDLLVYFLGDHQRGLFFTGRL